VDISEFVHATKRDTWRDVLTALWLEADCDDGYQTPNEETTVTNETISGMTLGRPADEPIIRPRLATDAILHWERYNASGEERLLEDYDRAMAQTRIYAGRQVEVPGTPGEVEDYGWREHSARRVSQPRRTDLRDVLVRQGFGLK
jgi:hypothetical protein